MTSPKKLTVKAYVKWSKDVGVYFVTKFYGSETENVNVSYFMTEEQLLSEKDAGTIDEVEYYD